MRVLAVDWSGAAHGARGHLWLAEAVEPGRLIRLEPRRPPPTITHELLAMGGRSAIGLDFAFSFPAWFVEQVGARSAPELWERVGEWGESWLLACEPPFWGRPGHRRPTIAGAALRRAEMAVPRVRGIGPKSVFQIGGAGTVGTGSIRGMPLLHQLHQAGATIWPCTRGGWPLVVEIYPRLLTGDVRKSKALERRALVAERYPGLDPEHARLATDSEDAFDAAVSALTMVEHVDDLLTLPEEPDAGLRLEGRIWHPGWQRDNP